MPHRFLKNLVGKSAPEAPAAPAAAPAETAPASNGALSAVAPQTAGALALSQELLRGIEQFVLPTPDLDTPGFLDRLRRMAAQLTGSVQPTELEQQRKWASESLAAFGQLQRRYLSEREDELWRLLTLYQDHLKVEGKANTEFHENLRGVHERIGNVVRLEDLRQVRARLETEIQKANEILDKKAQADDERASLLTARVQQLEAALVMAKHEAERDPMTGVYHRGGFETQLAALLASPNRCALAMIDLDNFKGINDTLGHLVGDHILKIAVQTLGKIARPGDVIGRFGGDEFCIVSQATTGEKLAERLDGPATQRTINFQFEGKYCQVRFSLSVGVASSVAGDTPQTLIQRADEALYEAKRAGKGRSVLARPPAPAAVST